MSQPFNIVILGGGTAGWMAANLFAHKWADRLANNELTVTLVESPDIGIVGVGEGSTPTLKRFFSMLGIADADWMRQCNATYKMNIAFKGFSPASGIDCYSHPFVSQIDTFTQRAFLVNARTRRLGLDTHTEPADFLLNGVLAKQNKGPQTPANFPFRMEYGYHFDSHLLGVFLQQHAISLGTEHIQANVDQVKQHENGDIAALCCKDGRELNGDLFVDCSGFSSVLMQKTLGVKFNRYQENLFNDSAVVVPTPIGKHIPVETTSTALSAGWCWKIPLTNRFGNGYVYSSDFISANHAERELKQHLQLGEDIECRHLSMQVGSLAKQWQNNCLGIGLSAGFIEPLEATALHLAQISVEQFILEFEEGGFTNRLQGQYNTKMHHRTERTRDYIVAHYKLNTRNDSEYWRANRNNMHLSESLLQILDVWYKRGDLEAEINRQNLSSHFNAVSWNCLLSGYGAFPPLAAKQPGTGDLYKEQNIESFLQGCALNFSNHAENLR
ncbi:MAG: tryptophan halogenase [Alteromonadaceae bacterium]|uniref:tryptophan halogenase family protein n=1 Tax=Paraglaciecola chathamensis TaxID=368405 RepID=UPI000C4BE5EB|nr:tryptophan halogenase family protein [Paraglaciecola agarilytica]MBN25194.1 tryptophan halogenase [Alteromonadaceae bacterium]|tara:strand:+ start:8453 stop:9949 length:1497 start_codon:yes stop_codon:yes gene_type:complete